jgi:hypothetical protein
MAQRNNRGVTGDDQAAREVPGGAGDSAAGTRGPGARDPQDRAGATPHPLGSMEAARRAADGVRELTGYRPEHVVSVTRQDDNWNIGLEVVELHRIPDAADILAVYDVTLDARGELVTCRRERRYLRGSTEEWR